MSKLIKEIESLPPHLVPGTKVTRLINYAKKLESAFEGLRYGQANCYCDISIGDPRMTDHSSKCIKAREVLESE